MKTAKLSSKSQIVIPAEIRRRLGMKPGDRLRIGVEGDRVVIEKASAGEEDDPLAWLREVDPGIWKGHAERVMREREEWDR